MRSRLFLLACCLTAFTGRPASAEAPDGSLKKIAERGAIVLGYRESSVPFSYLDENQKPVGFAIDICGKIVEEVKKTLGLAALEVRYAPVTSATRIPLLANGSIDLECGSTTNNAERAKHVAFANSHFLTASRFVSKKEKGFGTLDDLRGKTVVSTAGTTNIRRLVELNAERKLGINILSAKDHAEAFLMVQTDRAAAFVMDDILLAGLVASARDREKYVISAEALSRPEPYGVMLRRGDPAFGAVADRATAALYTSPEGRALYDKWFNRPINAAGLDLKFPMSPALEKAFAAPSNSSDPAAYGD